MQSTWEPEAWDPGHVDRQWRPDLVLQREKNKPHTSTRGTFNARSTMEIAWPIQISDNPKYLNWGHLAPLTFGKGAQNNSYSFSTPFSLKLNIIPKAFWVSWTPYFSKPGAQNVWGVRNYLESISLSSLKEIVMWESLTSFCLKSKLEMPCIRFTGLLVS